MDKEGYASTGALPNLRKYDLDVTDWENVYKTILSIGPVHGLVNNAGVAVIESFFDVTKSGWDELHNFFIIIYLKILNIENKLGLLRTFLRLDTKLLLLYNNLTQKSCNTNK